MKKTAFFWGTCLALFCGAFAHGAEIEKIGEWSDPCTFLLSGSVEAGDAARVAELDSGSPGYGGTLCLSSPGGDFLEGLKLFDVLWERGMGTRVRAGDMCASACAIAWLGGSAREGTLGVQVAKRNIEPGAGLGFHAPYMVLPEGDYYPSEQVSDAYWIALQHAKGIYDIQLTHETGVFALNQYLYRQTIATPGFDMHWITTVGEAIMSDVLVQGLRAPEELKRRNLINFCEAAYLQHNELDVDNSTADTHLKALRSKSYTSEQVQQVSLNDQEYWAVRLYGHERRQYFCVLSDYNIGELLRYASSINTSALYDQNGDSYVFNLGADVVYVDVWAQQPASDAFDALQDVDLSREGEYVPLPFYAFYDGNTDLRALSR